MKREQIESPGQILDITSGYWKSSTLHAAIELDVFSQLDTRELTAAELAKELKLNERGLEMLLNALVAIGLLVKEKNLFANTDTGAKFLTKNSDHYLGYIIQHHHHLVDGWSKLEDAVRQGGPVDMRSFGDEKERQSFLLGMHNMAIEKGPKIAKQVDLKNSATLLDLGGGPGSYAAHFCLANPSLTATVYDRSTSEPYMREVVDKLGVGDRISFVAGDFITDEIPGKYDAAWLSQILHSNGPLDCQKIIDKTVAALNPGGLIMVHEFFLNDTKAGPLFPALFSLNMLLNNGEGRSYSAGEITEMLQKAGVLNIHRHPYQGPNDAYILCGNVE